MPYFPGVGGRTYYQSWQPTRDVRSTVLVLHGYGEHLGLYEPLARWLTADGHAVYAVDALGHGRSDGERAVLPRFEDYVEDAWQVLSRRQQPGVPVTVIGHSGGAAAALLLALRHPRHVQALVLSGAAVAPWAWIEAVLASGVPETEPGDPTEFLSTHPDYVHALLQDPLTYKGGFRREYLLGLAATWPTIEVGLASGAPAVPTLFVSGAADQIVPVDMVRRVAGRLPDARLATFPGDLHDVLNEHDRDAVYQAVAAFLAETVVGQPVA